MSVVPPAIAVVLVTHDSADFLPATLTALVPQLRDDDELLIVDNVSGDGTPDVVRERFPRATVLETGANLGFAGGCNAGAAATTAELLLFLNPDATPQAGCLDGLRAAAGAHPDWGAWQALVTLPGGTAINTSGGITHYLGISWAGECDEPVRPAPDNEVGFASGAAVVVRRPAWEQVGGFDADFFMYMEDVDLSLRLRLAGFRVGIARTAVVEHDYDFDKGTRKWFLLERNRWRTVVRVYPPRLLALLTLPLLLFELALLPVAAAGGWLPMKLRAQWAVARELPRLRAERRRVQGLRRVDESTFAAGLTASLDSPYLAAARRLGPLVRAQGAFWGLVLRLLR